MSHSRQILVTRIMADARRLKGSRGSRARRELHRAYTHDSRRVFYQTALEYRLITETEYHALRTNSDSLWNYTGD